MGRAVSIGKIRDTPLWDARKRKLSDPMRSDVVNALSNAL
jgi:hypothetical protein